MATPIDRRGTRPAASPAGAGVTRRRPDPRPMRLAIGAGGLASMSALVALIGAAAIPTTSAAPAAVADPGVGAANDIAPVRHVVRYVVLAPGQLPPTGATTTPRSVAAAPVAAPTARPRPAVVTSQSGRP